MYAVTETDPAGIRWRLTEPGRELDANLVHLAPRQRIDLHTEPDLDVLIVVVTGSGSLTNGDRVLPLVAGRLAWLPRGAPRGLDAGDQGLAYLTVHRRRPGIQIRGRPV